MLAGIGGRRKRGRQRMRWLDGRLVFIGCVISYANEWEITPAIFGKGWRFPPKKLGHCPLLGLLTVPWNCHGASGCVV